MKLTLENISKLAQEVGFDACGVAPVHRLDDDARFMDNWIAQGLHGEMDYLTRNCNKRYDPAVLVPGAQTVVVCLLTFEHSGRDYHRKVKSMLYALEAKFKEAFGEDIVSATHQHIFCDSAPILERRWSVEAGLGFIGKNHQLIHPTLGSMVHPGEIVINQVVPISDNQYPIAEQCANCRLCLDACPTGALRNSQWDATQCIAYTTHHCLECQLPCPYNTHHSWFITHNYHKMKNLKLGIASDHAGFALKQTVIAWLQEQGAQVTDYGCPSTDSCDYPDFAHPMAASVENGTNDMGIAICSTGNGITMTCNHHQGIRAALCWDEPLARLARQHNNANIIGLPANYISEEKAIKLIKIFLTTEFEGGRHERRVNKISC